MSVLVVRALAAGGAALGLSLAELAERAGVAPLPLADPDARVPAAVVVALWEHLSSLRPNFGLWLAELVREAPFTVGSFVIHTSPTFGEGLARAMRYQRLLHDHARGHVVTRGDEATWRHQVGHFRGPNAALEFGFASLVHLAHRSTGQRIEPRRVAFQHAAPSDPSEHRRVFGPRVEFAQPYDEITFARADLERPLRTADPALRELIEAHGRVLLEKLPPDDTRLATRARAVIADLLRGGAPTLVLVAEKLGLPARTLQRRLREEGARFDALLDEVRRELATRYLADVRITIQETAFLLGFSEVAAFHRAFVRWTGETPARFRARHAA